MGSSPGRVHHHHHHRTTNHESSSTLRNKSQGDNNDQGPLTPGKLQRHNRTCPPAPSATSVAHWKGSPNRSVSGASRMSESGYSTKSGE
jgi:hypothetical protein